MRWLLALLALPLLPLLAYDVTVSADNTVRSQGQGGRVWPVPIVTTGCSTAFSCAIFDTQQWSLAFTPTSCPSGASTCASYEVGIATLTPGTATCITCGQHNTLFSLSNSTCGTDTTQPGNVGSPVLDPTGTMIALEVTACAQLGSGYCPSMIGAAPGTGHCNDVWTCAFNASFTASGNNSTNALSNCKNITNINSANKGSLHPRFGNGTNVGGGGIGTEYLEYAYQFAGSTSTYCTTFANSCSVNAVWEIVIGTISYSAPTFTWSGATYTISSIPTCTGTLAPCQGYWESGNFGGQRFSNTANNTDDGFFYFLSSAGQYGGPWYCPDLYAVYFSTGTISQLTTTGSRCLGNPTAAGNGAWNEHPQVDPSNTFMWYVSSVNNYWIPTDPSGPVPIPLDIHVAEMTHPTSTTAAIINDRRMTYGGGPWPQEPENTNNPANAGVAMFLSSVGSWAGVIGTGNPLPPIVRINTCKPGSGTGCLGGYGVRELVFNPFDLSQGITIKGMTKQ